MNGKSSKGKGKKKKKPAAKGGESLLSRWFKSGPTEDNGKPGAGKPKDKVKAKPLTPLERSIQEIKNMAKVGESDPERLAMLLSRLLGKEKEKQRLAQEDFDQMVWDIVHKDENDENAGDAGDDDSPPDNTKN